MTDFYPMEVATPQQQPLNVNQNYNSFNMSGPDSNVTYTTPCNYIIGVIIVAFFIMGTAFFALIIFLAIYNEDAKLIFVCPFPLIFTVVSIVLGIRRNIYYTITVDHYLKTVNIKSKRMCICCSKSNSIQISEIRQVIIRIDHGTSYNINGVYYNAFEIIFKLINGNDVRGCSGVINKNNEGARAASILRNSLPQNIIFGGELLYPDY